MNFGSISRYHVAAGVVGTCLIGGCVYARTLDNRSFRHFIQGGLIGNFGVALSTAIVLLTTIIRNIIIITFARFGAFEKAAAIFNRQPFFFINQHIVFFALAAPLTFALSIIGIVYLDETEEA